MTTRETGPTVLPVVDLADLFAMPLTALIEADADAAKTFVAFIREYGFEKPSGSDFEEFGKLKMVQFSYTKVGAGGIPQRSTVEIPLILLIPLPALAIQDATMRFDVEIFGIVERSKETTKALAEGRVPPQQRPVSLRPRQLKVRMARDTSRSGKSKETERAEARSRTNMAVEVNLRQSDLPQGILQLINLTAQGTQDSEVAVPYFLLASQDGRTTLSALGDEVVIDVTFVGLEDTKVARRHVSLTQDPEALFDMPRRVTTDDQGRAEFTIQLDEYPPSDGKALQTVSATAIVNSETYGTLLAQGSIRIQVDTQEE